MRRPLIFALLLSVSFGASSIAARADEGMWTFDAVPVAAIGQAYGYSPSPAFLDTLRLSALRLGDGCTASFVSPHGLIMTSHHCVADCVALASTPQMNYVELGFTASDESSERTCPNFEVDQLVRIEDVTRQMSVYLSGSSGQPQAAALAAAEATAIRSCGNNAAVKCEIVSLYGGAVYDLYHYRRYTDLRLVFAPEFAIAQFGGDAAIFDFPRYDFDIGFLRAYERGRPVSSPDYLHWSSVGTQAGSLVFAAANPGPTQRRLTMAELDFERRYRYPVEIPQLAEYRGILEEFGTRGVDDGREATGPLYAVQNALRAKLGEQRTLEDPQFTALRSDEEMRLRRSVAANPALQTSDGSAWDDLAALQTLRAHLYPGYAAVQGETFDSGLLGVARTLVRVAAERAKPESERLPEYNDASLIGLRAQLAEPLSNDADIEEVTLAFSLTKLRDTLGASDPLVQSFLDKDSPLGLAHRLVSGTKLGETAVRLALFDGGKAAIDASTDPMIAYAKYVDEDIRTVGKDYQTRIVLPTLAATRRIANARYAVYGSSVDPDGTYTLRLGYGTVAGFDANGTPVKPYTTFGGLFDGATASPPYALPASWLAAKASLDLATPMNVATTIDSGGGDSGRPLVDRDGHVAGLISGGNSFSLGTVFGFNPDLDRAVALDSRGILAGLDKVYHAERIVSEIEHTIP
jgi:hypothetical protein